MTIENRELYYELKECYPEFFDDLDNSMLLARGCGKSLLRTLRIMSIEYTRWFVYQLENSNYNLSKKEYEKGLHAIEKVFLENFEKNT